MRAKHIGVLLIGLVAVSSVFAAPINWQPLAEAMGNIWNLLGAMFSFKFVANDPVIKQGILKFLIFILLLRVVQMAAKKGMASFLQSDDEKTPIIVGIVVSLTTVIFTPNTILLSGVIMITIPLAVVLGLVYLAFSSEMCTGTRLKHFFGVIVMLFAAEITMYLIDLYKNPTLGGNTMVDISYIPAFVYNILYFLQMIVWILFLVKIIYWLLDGDFKIPGLSGGSDKDKKRKKEEILGPDGKPIGGKDADKDGDKGPKPGAPSIGEIKIA